ncbi:MAG: hypothetical protein AB8B72_07610 [Crocinitomicaceae bacterium]
MRKDIALPKVKDVGVAIVKELNKEKTSEIFNVYLINFGIVELENVLVTSRGYGINRNSGESVKTSILRHGLGSVQPKKYTKIEPIMENVFGITNEFWLSYYIKRQVFDKKFVFLAETVNPSNFIKIPIIEKQGVLIK